MHFYSDKPALSKALSTIAAVAETRDATPIYSRARLCLDGDRLTVECGNGDITATMGLNVEGPRGGSAILPARDLAAIFSNLPDGAQVELIESDDRGYCTIRAGRSRYRLPALPGADWPQARHGDTGAVNFTIAATTLKELLGNSGYAICTDTARYYLNGVFFHFFAAPDRPTLRSVATNGHVLACIDAPAPPGCEAMPPIIIPHKTAAMLQKSLTGFAGDCLIEVSDTRLNVQIGDLRIDSKLIDGTFPDYQRILPAARDASVVITLAASDLRAAAARMAAVDPAKVKKTNGLRFIASKSSVTLFAATEDGGESEEVIEASASGDIEIGFNARYLAQVAAVCGDGHLTIRIIDKPSPVRFEPDDLDALHIVMPMRVS